VGRAGEIQANLKAILVETATPIQVAREVEVVPLDAYAGIGDSAVQWLPSAANVPPRAILFANNVASRV
jgi:hypothetical protein